MNNCLKRRGTAPSASSAGQPITEFSEVRIVTVRVDGEPVNVWVHADHAKPGLSDNPQEKQMKPAIEALAMADHFFLPIESGKKRITIREGHRDYTVGSPLILFCKGVPEHWIFQSKVESVRHTSLGKITKEEGEADGFTSPEDMLEGMRQYYPHMDMKSDVTVVTWGDVS